MFAPEIQVAPGTQPLVLREITPDDLQTLPTSVESKVGHWIAPKFREGLNDLFQQKEESAVYQSWSQRNSRFIWGVHNTEEERLVGMTGLYHKTQDELLPPDYLQVEGSTVIFREWDLGQRIGSLVAPYRAAFAMFMGCDSLQLTIHRDNRRSNRLARSMGCVNMGLMWQSEAWRNDFRLFAPHLDSREIIEHTQLQNARHPVRQQCEMNPDALKVSRTKVQRLLASYASVRQAVDRTKAQWLPFIATAPK